jgi:hypothetical protein
VSLRIGVDLDGTLADLSSMYHQYEDELFGDHGVGIADDAEGAETAGDAEPAPEPEPQPELSDKAKLKAAKEATRRRDAVWRALRNTPDLWTLLDPIEEGAVRQLQEAVNTHNWEVFFITQRPKSKGASVQAQSQRWLIAQGFEVPSVLTLTGSRGKAAHALDLDFLIDDLPKNCVDVVSDSKCRPILVLREPDPAAEAAAKRMNIGVVRSVCDAVAFLKQPAETPRKSIVSNVLRHLGLAR